MFYEIISNKYSLSDPLPNLRKQFRSHEQDSRQCLKIENKTFYVFS